MAQPDIGQLLQNLAGVRSHISNTLGFPWVKQIIFSVEGGAKSKERVKSIGKYAVHSNLGNNGIKRVAYNESQGPVSW